MTDLASPTQVFHLQGQHDQSTHGNRGGGRGFGPQPPFSPMEQLWMAPPAPLMAAIDEYTENPFPQHRQSVEHQVAVALYGEDYYEEWVGHFDQIRPQIEAVTEHLTTKHGWRDQLQLELDHVAAVYSTDPETLRSEIEAGLADRLDASPVSMRVTFDVMDQVVDDGRFKNLFETGTGFGWQDQELRKQGEWEDFGLDPGVGVEGEKSFDHSARPLYGYMDIDGLNSVDGARPYGETDDPRWGRLETLEQYGDIRIEFTDEVRTRTSYTFGDSLDGWSEPAPLAAPTVESMGNRYDGWTRGRSDLIGPTDELFHNVGRYVEAQIHGGATVGDIAMVWIPNRTMEDVESFVGKLESNGIPWTIVEDTEMPLAAAAGGLPGDERTIYVAPDGARIILVDDANRTGSIVRNGRTYPPVPVIVHLAHGVWAPVGQSDGIQVFHLQGQHDQKTHGNRGGAALNVDNVRAAYSTTLGSGIRTGAVVLDIGDNMVVDGFIWDSDDNKIGNFRRSITDGTVKNELLEIAESHQGQGIASEFLDITESRLAEMGVERAVLDAASVGRYAWAARGYRLFDYPEHQIGYDIQTGIIGEWTTAAESVIPRLDPAKGAAARAVLSQWADDQGAVFPADLLAVDPAFKDVFGDGPRWKGERSLSRDRDELSVEQFHLQGQHDQSTHGNRATGRRIDRVYNLAYDQFAEQAFHLQGQHDQSTHGNWAKGATTGTMRRDLVGLDGHVRHRVQWESDMSSGYGDLVVTPYALSDDTGVYKFTYTDQRADGLSVMQNPLFDVRLIEDDVLGVVGLEAELKSNGQVRFIYEGRQALAEFAKQNEIRIKFVDDASAHLRHGVNEDGTPIDRPTSGRDFDEVAAYDTIHDTYNQTFTAKNGREYLMVADPTVDSPGGGRASGWIEDYETGQVVADFDRNVDLEGGFVMNDRFRVRPEYQGLGIGSAFLDASESSLRDAGITEADVTAVDVGRYAWAARGYKVGPSGAAAAAKNWLSIADDKIGSYDLTDVQRSQYDALSTAWRSGQVDVYGSDLLAIDSRFRDVFLDDRADTWSGTLDLTGADRARVFVDPNQPELDLAVEVFHLQGQHDQSTHGNRGAIPPDSAAARRALGWQPVKGVISSRQVEFHEYDNIYRVTADDGTVIEASVFASGDDHTRLRTDEWRHRTVDILNGATDAYNLAPTSVPPQVMIMSKLPSGLPPGAQEAIAMVNTGGQTNPNRYYAAPSTVADMPSNAIIVNATADPGEAMWALFEEQAESIMMPAVASTNVAHYTGAHEYGHVRAGTGDDPKWRIFEVYDKIRPYSLSEMSPEWEASSRYAKANAGENHAEAFAEWALTDGTTTNALARAYAAEFGWDDELDLPLAAAAGPVDVFTGVLFDTPYGPGFVDVDGSVITWPLDDTAEVFRFDPSQPRDDDGRWTDGVNSAGRTLAEEGKANPHERASDNPDDWFADDDEFAAAKFLADEKARNVPKPTQKQIDKNLRALEKAKTRGRAGGELRGNSYTRRARAEALFAEFGGDVKGYCPCSHCGIKVSPKGRGGYASMQQDKILVASEGGSYGTARSFPNLIPACGGCNSSRNDEPYPVRPEWQVGMAASGGGLLAAFGMDRVYVAVEAEGRPVGWQDPTLDIGDREVVGPYYVRQAKTWFGSYDQHVIAGETVDLATITITEKRPEGRAVEMVWDSPTEFHLQGQHDQSTHGNRGGASGSGLTTASPALRPATGVYSDEYGQIDVRSTGVDRIRQVVYEHDGGQDVFDVVLVEDDGEIVGADVANLYGADGTIEGEAAVEAWLNQVGIDDVTWDSDRAMQHATARAAEAAGAATERQQLVNRVEDVYSGTFTASGIEYEIGDVNVVSREGMTEVSTEVSGSIYADGDEIGTFRRAVHADGTVYNHSLSIDPDMQGFGIGTAFLDKTEADLGPATYKLAAVNVGKYAWAARGYRLDTQPGSSLWATTRDVWISDARNFLSNTPEWRAGDYSKLDALEAVRVQWSLNPNSIYPSDILAIDPALKTVLLQGPSWDAIRDADGLTATAGVQVFHLQGQHNQKDHGNRGGASAGGSLAALEAAYTGRRFKTASGAEFEIHTMQTRELANGAARIEGVIRDGNNTVVGMFGRTLTADGVELHNNFLEFEPEYQGQGIGSAFLDQTEASLVDSGTRVMSLAAEDVGKYAWAARGYGTDNAFGEADDWMVAIDRHDLAHDVRHRREVRAVLDSWRETIDNGGIVYPADILAVSSGFRDVFLEGPEWFGEKQVGPLGYRHVDRDDLTVDDVLVFRFDPSQPRDDHGRWTDTGGAATPELVVGRYYRPDEYPALTSDDEVFEATQMWAAPGQLGGRVFNDRGELPYVEMAAAANRAVRGLEIRATKASAMGVGLMKGMSDAPRTTEPHYRALDRDFDPRRGVDALTSATPDLELAIDEYLPRRGSGALIRFEPGTPHREALAGSWGQTRESIVSGQFKFTKIGPNDLTEDEMMKTYNLNEGTFTPVYSAVWEGFVDDPTEELAVEAAELSFDPSQPRDDHGRWTSTGGSSPVPRDGRALWIFNGYSPNITAAAAALTGTEDGYYDTGHVGADATDVARSLLADIHRQPTKTTTYFSGHGFKPGDQHTEVGDIIDIPLMAVTPDAKLADAYREMSEPALSPHPWKEVTGSKSRMLDAIAEATGGGDIEAALDSNPDLRDVLISRAPHVVQANSRHGTVYEFESSQSIPLRPNERITSGRYEVTGVRDSDTEGSWYRTDEGGLVERRSRVVTLRFVEPLNLDATAELSFDPGQPRDDHGRWTDTGSADYHGGHRPTDTGPRIFELTESEASDGLDVYENPRFFTGYSGRELDETMRQIRSVRGDPDATVTIYRAAPQGSSIHPGDWVTLSPTYARNHIGSNNAGPDGVVLQLEVPAKSVRWALDDLMEYGWFPESQDDHHRELTAEVFHLKGTEHDHNQQSHAGGAAKGNGWAGPEFADPPPGYRQEYQDEWRAAYAWMADNDPPSWWLGTDIFDEDGLPKRRYEVGQNWDEEGIGDAIDAFRDEVGDEIAGGVWSIGRQAEQRRKQAVQEAIAMNEIDLEAAKERWGYDADPEHGQWEELPAELFHATSALDAIVESGALKTRAEIGGRDNAAGLGGGSADTISFTSDRSIAEGITRSLHEVHRAVNMSNDDLVAALRERSGSWWPDVQASAKSVHGKDVPETVEDRYNLFRTFAAYRERNDGILDPLFFNVDSARLAAMDPDQIGIVTVAPAVPGARGYQVSALGEWRTPTGRATTIIGSNREEDMEGFRVGLVELAFDPGQPRDEDGRWTSSGWSGGTLRRPTAVDPGELVSVVGENDEAAADAVYDYTVGDHEPMNAWLRGVGGDSRPDLADRLTAAIDRSPGLSRDVELYRGATTEALADARVGDIIEDPAFVSTSADEYVASMFEGYGEDGAMIKIRVPKGTKAVIGEESLSEVILQRHTRTRFDGYEDGWYLLTVVS